MTGMEGTHSPPGRDWRAMQEPEVKGSVSPRKELKALSWHNGESSTIYQKNEKIRHVSQKDSSGCSTMSPGQKWVQKYLLGVSVITRVRYIGGLGVEVSGRMGGVMGLITEWTCGRMSERSQISCTHQAPQSKLASDRAIHRSRGCWTRGYREGQKKKVSLVLYLLSLKCLWITQVRLSKNQASKNVGLYIET